MTGPDGVTRVVPGEHVDRDAVERSRAALAGNGHAALLDLGRVRSWDRDALGEMTALLDTAPGSLRVAGPRATSFLGVLDAADVEGIWPVFDDVRRLRRAAARFRSAPEQPASGPRAPRRRVPWTLPADPARSHAARVPAGDAAPDEEER